MMTQTISLACLGLLFSGALGCAAEVTPTDADNHERALADWTAAAQSFEVQVPRDVTAETVIPAIVDAARGELSPVCAANLSASIRITNPLASGEYADVSCTSVLLSEGTTETSAALSSESIGEARQAIGPITFVACGLILGGSGLILSKALCPRGRTERDRQICSDVGLGGGIALGILCSLPL